MQVLQSHGDHRAVRLGAEPDRAGRGLRLIVLDQDFEGAWARRERKGALGLCQGELRGDQAGDIDAAGGERADGGREAAAAGADHGDLVDHERGEGKLGRAGDSALEHQGPARSGRLDGHRKARSRAGRLDDKVSRRPVPWFEQRGADAASLEDREFLRVLADREDVCARQEADLGREQAELAVAEDNALHAWLDMDLLDDLEGRGEGLDEGGMIIAHRVRDNVEVRDRDADELGEGAVSAEDAHDRTRWAMAAEVPG